MARRQRDAVVMLMRDARTEEVARALYGARCVIARAEERGDSAAKMLFGVQAAIAVSVERTPRRVRMRCKMRARLLFLRYVIDVLRGDDADAAMPRCY